MTEYIDPPLRLTVEGLRWLGDEFTSTGDGSAGIDLLSTDADEDAVAVLRALRRIAAKRLWMALAAASISQDALDFDAPNAPTEDNLKELTGHIKRALAAAEVLTHLAPEIDDGDDPDA